MGCDISQYARRRLWEKDQAALCAEKGGVGFANKGQPALQVWCDWDEIDWPLFWNWVPENRLLLDDLTNPLRNLNYGKSLDGGNRSVTVTSFGYVNEETSMNGEKFSVGLQMALTYIVPASPLPNLYRMLSGIHLLAPLVTDSYRFPVFAEFFNDQAIGFRDWGCTVVPLDRCHECSDDV